MNSATNVKPTRHVSSISTSAAPVPAQLQPSAGYLRIVRVKGEKRVSYKLSKDVCPAVQLHVRQDIKLNQATIYLYAQSQN